MNEGYIKAYRKTMKSRVFKNEGLFKVWMWCLWKASYNEQWVILKTGKGSIEVHLLPGQFIFGRESAAKELGMKPSTVRNRIQKLKKMGNVDIKVASQYSIIIIINWDTYQVPNEKEDRRKDRQRTGKGHIQEGKEGKEDIYAQSFCAFWNLYPRKVEKKRAFKIWQKLNPDEKLAKAILSAVERQKNSEWKDREFKHIPHPSTWLNGERWNDEIQPKEEEDSWRDIPKVRIPK